MKKDNLIKGAAVLGTLALMAGGVVAADAAINNYNKPNFDHARQGMAGLNEQDRDSLIAERESHQAEMEVKRTETQAAISAGDYNAWLEAEGDNSPIIDKINQDNFVKFAKAHELMGEARAIFEELGLEGAGHGKGFGSGEGRGMHRGLNR
jgi:hypothetical protein